MKDILYPSHFYKTLTYITPLPLKSTQKTKNFIPILMTTVVTIGSVLILRLQGLLDKYLKKRNIKHNFIYPRCPRINQFIERVNRTLQEEFIDLHLNLLAEDIDRI